MIAGSAAVVAEIVLRRADVPVASAGLAMIAAASAGIGSARAAAARVVRLANVARVAELVLAKAAVEAGSSVAGRAVIAEASGIVLPRGLSAPRCPWM